MPACPSSQTAPPPFSDTPSLQTQPQSHTAATTTLSTQFAHSLDAAGKRRLLAFVTGSPRAPAAGLGALSPPLSISRNGGGGGRSSSDSGDGRGAGGAAAARLPSAHTCFNHLLLPAYRDRETLFARLRVALEHCEGFGLM